MPVYGPRPMRSPDLKKLRAEATVHLAAPRVDALVRTALFATLDEATLRDLLESIVVEEYAEGENVVRQGERGDALYLIVRGEVAVLHEGATLREVGRLG